MISLQTHVIWQWVVTSVDTGRIGLDSVPGIDFLQKINQGIMMCLKKWSWGFAGGSVVKNPPASAGDTGSIPGLGRFNVPQSN